MTYIGLLDDTEQSYLCAWKDANKLLPIETLKFG